MAPAEKLSRRGRHSGGTAVLVERKFEKYVPEVRRNDDKIVLLMLHNLVLNRRKSVCLCAAYINPFDSPYYEHLGVDNTYFFDAIEGTLLDTVNTVDGCEIILCGARTADRSCLTISIDENDEEDIVFEHDRWSQDSKRNGFGEKLLEFCYSLEITIWSGLFDRKGGEFMFVSHSGSSVVDYFTVSDELLERMPDVSIAERLESKHFPVQMKVEVHDYNIADVSAKEITECKTLEKIVWGADRSNEFAESLEQLGGGGQIDRTVTKRRD